mmetsp:Transcript_14856/g.25154  ORF Transcript_14856/g.25154 Transcript_14856/m.25154 type:complete len:205 (+) Transcript_14856:1264-1878(+)
MEGGAGVTLLHRAVVHLSETRGSLHVIERPRLIRRRRHEVRARWVHGQSSNLSSMFLKSSHALHLIPNGSPPHLRGLVRGAAHKQILFLGYELQAGDALRVPGERLCDLALRFVEEYNGCVDATGGDEILCGVDVARGDPGLRGLVQRLGGEEAVRLDRLFAREGLAHLPFLPRLGELLRQARHRADNAGGDATLGLLGSVIVG